MRHESENSPQKLANVEFLAAFTAQDSKLEAIMSFMRDMRTEVGEMRKSMDFTSTIYDELHTKCQNIEQEQNNYCKIIKSLETKIDFWSVITNNQPLKLKIYRY